MNLKMSKIIKNILTQAQFPKRLISTTRNCYGDMNDPLEHATGIEKRELLAKKAGIKDPFGLDTIIKRGAGTLDSPTLIPSAFAARLVGCMCHDRRHPVWMWLEKDCPKRCECGFWFELKEVPPF